MARAPTDVKPFAVAFALLLVACSKKSPPTSSTSSALTTDGGSAFGGTCATDNDCASHVCWSEKQFCTLKCTSDADCATPPTAGKCNKKGYCKKP